MPVPTLDNIRDRSVKGRKLKDNTLPMSTVQGLDQTFSDFYHEASTGGPLTGYIRIENLSLLTTPVDKPFVLRLAIDLLKEGVTATTVHVEMNGVVLPDIAPEQVVSGYPIDLPDDVRIDDILHFVVYVNNSIGTHSNILAFDVSVTKSTSLVIVDYCHRMMKSSYPGVSFDNNLWFHPVPFDRYKEHFPEPSLASYGGIEVMFGQAIVGSTVTEVFYTKMFSDTENCVYTNFFTNATIPDVFYMVARAKDKTSGAYTDWSYPKKILKSSCQTNIPDDSDRILLFTTSLIKKLAKSGSYAIDAYGAGSGGCCTRIGTGNSGCHSYKNTIVLLADDELSVIVGAGGLSAKQSGTAAPTRNSMGGMTSITITGSTDFLMKAPGGRGHGAIGTNQFLNPKPTDYEYWEGITGDIYLTNGTDNSGAGRDGFLYHPGVNGDKGSLNDCASGNRIKIARGNITKPSNHGGGYLVPGNSTTTYDGAPWGGGGGYHYGNSRCGGRSSGGGSYGDAVTTGWDTLSKGGDGFLILVRTNLDEEDI